MKQLLYKYKSFIKYLICGGSSTAIDFLVYMILSSHINISIAKFTSMCIASIFSFFVNKGWTFEDNRKITKVQIFKYILTQIINISVNVGFNKVIYTLSNMKICAFIIATVVAMIVNYFMQKIIVFKKEDVK